MNVHNIFHNECAKIDKFIQKYLTKRDLVLLKIYVIIMAVFTGWHTSLILEYIHTDVRWCHKKFTIMFPKLEEYIVMALSPIVPLLDDLIYIAGNCGQVMVDMLYLCLGILFKRICMANGNKRKHSVSTVKLLLDDHSTLCDIVESIDDKISVVLLLYTCNDILWLLLQMHSLEAGSRLSWISFSFQALTCLRMILRLTTLIYLSDQVRHR